MSRSSNSHFRFEPRESYVSVQNFYLLVLVGTHKQFLLNTQLNDLSYYSIGIPSNAFKVSSVTPSLSVISTSFREKCGRPLLGFRAYMMSGSRASMRGTYRRVPVHQILMYPYESFCRRSCLRVGPSWASFCHQTRPTSP